MATAINPSPVQTYCSVKQDLMGNGAATVYTQVIWADSLLFSPPKSPINGGL